MLVDAFVADTNVARLRQPGADLLRAPFFTAKLGLDQGDDVGGHLAWHAVGGRPAGNCSGIGFLAAIVIARAIAPQLAADRRLAAADLRRDRRLRQTKSIQRRHLAALLIHQMLAHRRPLPPRSSLPSSCWRPGYRLCVSELNPRGLILRSKKRTCRPVNKPARDSAQAAPAPSPTRSTGCLSVTGTSFFVPESFTSSCIRPRPQLGAKKTWTSPEQARDVLERGRVGVGQPLAGGQALTA